MQRLFLLLLPFLLFGQNDAFEQKPKRILHITFHQGCINAFTKIAKDCGYEVENWFIPNLPPYFFDGVSKGNVLYNMTHERAENIWNLHKDFFHQFDLVTVSDTAPLSRIFVQNGFTKPLLIWICNRFDYVDEASRDATFPDPEYYALFQKATQMPNVKIAGYTPFELYYARKKGIDIEGECLPPTLKPLDELLLTTSNETFLLPPYHNEIHFMDLETHLKQFNLPVYRGRYNGPSGLSEFKAIIHLPYSWSNLALFEAISLGVPYFIPSKEFFKKLANQNNYFLPNLAILLRDDILELTEWYAPDRDDIFIHFDSWEDLVEKTHTTNYALQRQKVLDYAKKYHETTMLKWKNLLNSLMNLEP